MLDTVLCMPGVKNKNRWKKDLSYLRSAISALPAINDTSFLALLTGSTKPREYKRGVRLTLKLLLIQIWISIHKFGYVHISILNTYPNNFAYLYFKYAWHTHHPHLFYTKMCSLQGTHDEKQ